MFKTIGTLGAMALIGSVWFTYAVLGPTPCAKVHRGAMPIRLVLTAVQWSVNPWADSDQRWMFARWLIKGDDYVKSFIARQFYGENLSAICVRHVPDTSGAASKSEAKKEVN